MFYRYMRSYLKKSYKKNTIQKNIDYLALDNINRDLVKKKYVNYYNTRAFRNYLPNIKV